MKFSMPLFVAVVAVATGGAVTMIAIDSSGSGVPAAELREVRELDGFTAITIAGGIGLELTQGDEFFVEVEASDGSVDALHTEVDGTLLDIHRGAGSDRFFGLFSVDYTVRVTMPQIDSLSVNRGAAVDGTNTLTGDELEIVAGFGGAIDLTVDVASVSVESSFGSQVDLEGSARAARLVARNGCEFNGRNFVADAVDVDISAGSDVFVGVADRITGQVASGSNLTYRGTPATVEVSASGGARVSSR